MVFVAAGQVVAVVACAEFPALAAGERAFAAPVAEEAAPALHVARTAPAHMAAEAALVAAVGVGRNHRI